MIGRKRTVIILGLYFSVVIPIAAMDRVIDVLEQVDSKWGITNVLENIGNIITYPSYYLVNVNNKDECGNTQLHWAIISGNVKAAALLLKRGANIESKNCLGWTPLYQAVLGDNIDIIALLLAKGANINSVDNCEYTPLHTAVLYNNSLKLLGILVDKGAHLESRNICRETPLDMALRNQHVEAVKLLLERGATSRESIHGGTISHRAAHYGNVELVALLLDANASAALESRDNSGYSFLYDALENLNSQDADTQRKAQQIVDIVVKNKRYYISTSVRPTTLVGLTALYLLKKSRERNNVCMIMYIPHSK